MADWLAERTRVGSPRGVAGIRSCYWTDPGPGACSVWGAAPGVSSVLLVLGFTSLLQLFENNVLMPRLMSKTIGISSLMSLFAILAFGTLYGVLGAFIAIPLTVVLQVLLERIFIHPEPLSQDPFAAHSPLRSRTSPY